MCTRFIYKKEHCPESITGRNGLVSECTHCCLLAIPFSNIMGGGGGVIK